MSAVRPEFGPTLPELAGPHLRRLPAGARAALAALAALVVLALAWLLLIRDGEDRTVVVVASGVPVPFNFTYDDGLRRTPPAPGEAVALTGDGLRFSVSPLRLPPYEGDSAGTFPVLATRLADQMAARYEGFTLRQEGRANINRQQGYELYFQFRREGRTWYGRRTMLLPEPTDPAGADILLLARRSPGIPKFSAVGTNGPLKVALRSFRFGTERP